jgi:hypothetical protein
MFLFYGKLSCSKSPCFYMDKSTKTHGQQSSKHIVNNHSKHCQTSSNNMVKHRQTTWSTIALKHGQPSSKHMVKHHRKHAQQSSNMVNNHQQQTTPIRCAQTWHGVSGSNVHCMQPSNQRWTSIERDRCNEQLVDL